MMYYLQERDQVPVWLNPGSFKGLVDASFYSSTSSACLQWGHEDELFEQFDYIYDCLMDFEHKNHRTSAARCVLFRASMCSIRHDVLSTGTGSSSRLVESRGP